MEDHILHLSMVLMVCRFYLEKDDKPTRDFMISPLYTPDHILKEFPKTYLLICEKDPMHDDCVRFFLRML